MTATVLVVEDDAALRESLVDTLRDAGYAVRAATSGEEALRELNGGAAGLVITDVRMDGMDGHRLLREIRARPGSPPVVVMTAYGTVRSAVQAMREGAADYLVKPFDASLLLDKVAQHLRAATLAEGGGEEDLVAVDARMRDVIELARRVAANDVTVLLTGESGTGKEVLARYIHRRSRRSGGPFVAINCAAIPDNMLEAVLFGYEKGAFTGAVQACPGKFEQAQGGTLLLDEISEMNLGLQAKLLRVLQEREVERLGGRRAIGLDVRVLATTNRLLREEVAAGRFREDLYYRLNVFPLALPPLRERRGDIVPLAGRLLERHAARTGRAAPRLTEAAAARLIDHDWPGNVRELENVVQRALILCGEEGVTESDLSFETAARNEVAGEALGRNLRAREHQLILEALSAEGGRRKQAAERLGISPRTLRYKLARMREAGIAVSFPAQPVAISNPPGDEA